MIEKLLLERGLSLERLNTFAKVAAAKGVMRAAGGDAVTQSLFSRQIKELETFFGTALISRAGSGIALTPAGEELYDYVSQMFSTLNEFKLRCQKAQAHFIIHSSHTFFDWFMLPSLNRLHQKYPGVKYSLVAHRTTSAIQSVASQRADIGIVRDFNIPPTLKKQPLFSLTYAIYIPKRMATRVDVNDLSAYPFALSTEGYTRDQIDILNRERNLGMRVMLSCRNSTQTREALATGHYATVLPLVRTQPLIDPSRYHILTPRWLSKLNCKLAIIWNPRHLKVKPSLEKILRDLPEILNEHGTAGSKRR